jgi:hypothetical protein
LDELKSKARTQGLWNLFLPKETDGGKYGAGYTNLEYALMAEATGHSLVAPEIFNCRSGSFYSSSSDGAPPPPTCFLLAVHQILETWKYSSAMAQSNRKRSGFSLFSMEKFEVALL